MKKTLATLLLAALAAPASATWTVSSTLPVGDNFTATDGTWNLKFSRSTNDGGYSCQNDTGTGGAKLDLTTFNNDMATAGVTWNNKPVTVIGIYNEGFLNLSGLTEVKLPSTVKTLSNQCLSGTGLAGEFVIPDSVTSFGDAVFRYCRSLKRVVVNENIKTLQNTFTGCTSLEEVKIASGTTSLSGSPFRDCPALVSVYADEADRAVGTVTLPATVTALSSYAFYRDYSIKRVVAPGVTTVAERVFQDCTALEEVSLPALQEFSSTYTFCGCSSLQRIELPVCAKLGQATFQDCPALVEVLVSPALSSIGFDCFRNCTAFRTLYTNEATKVEGHVQIPAAFKGTIGGYTFRYTKIERIDAPGATGIGGERAFEGCTLLEEAHLPSLASMSGTYAFSGCPLLTKVEVSPNLAGTIGDCGFSSCYSLESVYQSGNEPVVGLVDLPAGVTTIKWGCFWHCGAIEHVVAPGVTAIHNRGFRDCRLLKTVRFSPELSLLDNNSGSSSDCAINDCPALVDFYPSTMPNLTALKAGTFVNDSSLTNSFDFSGATLSDTSGAFFLSGAKNVPCVRLPASFPKLYDREFYNMKPGAEIHFAGGIPPFNNNYPLWQGQNGAGYRYKIFVDAENFPAWTNGTVSGATFTPKTAAMEDESDYPGIATLGYLNYASNGQNNWLVQEPFYVDVTFYDENGTTVLDVVKTLLGAAPSWTNAAPTKASSAQYDYAFAGWSTDGSTVVDLSTLRADGPMSLRAVYTPVLRSYDIVWQWFDGTAAQSDTTTVDYGETPAHAAVEQAPSGGHTYTFLGWSTDGSTVLASIPSVTGPATYVAVFEEKDAALTVTVRWLDDDGTTVLATTWPDAGTAAVAPLAPEKESTVATNFAFAGWSTDGETVLTDLTVSAATDFVAVYTPSVREYTVAFVDWNGAAISSADYDYGTAAASISVPANPSRAADARYTYAFAGWTPAIAGVTGDATYTATYTATPKTYAATFVDWDGTVLAGPTDYAYGASVVPPENPVREGYTFAGWSPAVSIMPASDTVYAATYTLNKYTLKWMNGDGPTTAKYDYGTPVSGISVPAGSKTSTTKYYYRFVGWTPAIEPVQSNTTYTAMFSTLAGRPMKLALDDVTVAAGHDAFTVSATLSDFSSTATAPTTTVSGVRHAPGGRTGEIFGGTATLASGTVTATLSGLSADGGYDWEIVALQDILGTPDADRAVLRGRSYAKRHQIWFEAADVAWTNGLFTPAKPAAALQQIRIRSVLAVPAVAPHVHAVATGHLVGIEAFDSGADPAWHAWDGAKWIRLEGAVPPCGGTATVLTVVDFATKTPTATWYVDGLPLATADGEWAIPLAGGTRLSSFADAAGLASSLWADYDLGAPATMLLIR